MEIYEMTHISSLGASCLLTEGCHIQTQVWQVKMLILRLTNMRVIW